MRCELWAWGGDKLLLLTTSTQYTVHSSRERKNATTPVFLLDNLYKEALDTYEIHECDACHKIGTWDDIFILNCLTYSCDHVRIVDWSVKIFVAVRWFIFSLDSCPGKIFVFNFLLFFVSVCQPSPPPPPPHSPLIDFKSDKFFPSFQLPGSMPGTALKTSKVLSLYGCIVDTKYSFIDSILCIIHFCQNQNNHEILYSRMMFLSSWKICISNMN